ncbi:MAG: isochorismatase family protein [Blastochloris sp.]|nr:isochorismatase family protein [Blastochloris sp.]
MSKRPEPSESILVIVDMQPFYKASNSPKLKRELCKLIKHHPNPICVVSYKGSGPVHEFIHKAIKGKQVFYVEKEGDDGGKAVVNAARKHGFGSYVNYAMCGVNASICVIRTARSILKAKRGSAVYMMVRCCGDSTADMKYTALQIFCDENPNRRVMVYDCEWTT